MDKEIENIINNIDFDKWVSDALQDSAKDQTKNNTVSGSSDAVQGSHNAQKQTEKQKADKTTKEKRKAAGAENTKQSVNTSADAAVAKDHVNQKSTADHAENIKDNADYNNNAAGGADASGGLPFDFCNTIKNIIFQWCIDNEIENMRKASSLQWGAACMFCGQYIKQNKILYDIEKTAARGGVCQYDLEKVIALADIWVYLCQTFGKIPLVNDFIYFSGVSRGWFYGSNGHNNNTLTSAGGELIKKLSDLQAAAFASGISDGRENPTGKIYLTKALFGWSDTGGGMISADDRQEKTAALPDLSVLELPKL